VVLIGMGVGSRSGAAGRAEVAGADLGDGVNPRWRISRSAVTGCSPGGLAINRSGRVARND
jgi:hypothetical protein